MEIIREGDLRRAKHIKRFYCRECGCVFDADNSEYRYDTTQYNEDSFYCKCPTCGHKAYDTKSFY